MRSHTLKSNAALTEREPAQPGVLGEADRLYCFAERDREYRSVSRMDARREREEEALAEV